LILKLWQFVKLIWVFGIMLNNELVNVTYMYASAVVDLVRNLWVNNKCKLLS